MRTVLLPSDVPETKPATELLDGVLVQKLSPLRKHGQIQMRLSWLIESWRNEHEPGWAAIELDVDVVVGNDRPERFVPDIAYVVSSESSDDSVNGPHDRAPTVAFEIASPGDSWRPRTEYKLGRYLAGGSKAVVVVDPLARTIVIHTLNAIVRLSGNDEFVLDAMPGFRFKLDALFRVLDRR